MINLETKFSPAHPRDLILNPFLISYLLHGQPRAVYPNFLSLIYFKFKVKMIIMLDFHFQEEGIDLLFPIPPGAYIPWSGLDTSGLSFFLGNLHLCRQQLLIAEFDEEDARILSGIHEIPASLTHQGLNLL